jgi:hypothetical protein
MRLGESGSLGAQVLCTCVKVDCRVVRREWHKKFTKTKHSQGRKRSMSVRNSVSHRGPLPSLTVQVTWVNDEFGLRMSWALALTSEFTVQRTETSIAILMGFLSK